VRGWQKYIHASDRARVLANQRFNRRKLQPWITCTGSVERMCLSLVPNDRRTYPAWMESPIAVWCPTDSRALPLRIAQGERTATESFGRESPRGSVHGCTRRVDRLGQSKRIEYRGRTVEDFHRRFGSILIHPDDFEETQTIGTPPPPPPALDCLTEILVMTRPSLLGADAYRWFHTSVAAIRDTRKDESVSRICSIRLASRRRTCPPTNLSIRCRE